MKNIYEIRANPDIILPIKISFAESCFGKHHTRIKYKRYDKCPDCNCSRVCSVCRNVKNVMARDLSAE